jgi:hypothetical protein
MTAEFLADHQEVLAVPETDIAISASADIPPTSNQPICRNLPDGALIAMLRLWYGRGVLSVGR